MASRANEPLRFHCDLLPRNQLQKLRLARRKRLGVHRFSDASTSQRVRIKMEQPHEVQIQQKIMDQWRRRASDQNNQVNLFASQTMRLGPLKFRNFLFFDQESSQERSANKLGEHLPGALWEIRAQNHQAGTALQRKMGQLSESCSQKVALFYYFAAKSLDFKIFLFQRHLGSQRGHHAFGEILGVQQQMVHDQRFPQGPQPQLRQESIPQHHQEKRGQGPL